MEGGQPDCQSELSNLKSLKSELNDAIDLTLFVLKFCTPYVGEKTVHRDLEGIKSSVEDRLGPQKYLPACLTALEVTSIAARYIALYGIVYDIAAVYL